MVRPSFEADAELAAGVTLIVRERDLGESMSRYLIDRIQRNTNIGAMLGTEVRELLGDQVLEATAVEDDQTSARTVIKARSSPGPALASLPDSTLCRIGCRVTDV